MEEDAEEGAKVDDQEEVLFFDVICDMCSVLFFVFIFFYSHNSSHLH